MISETLIKRLREAKHLAILTGAGISAESGIPTFRDAMTGLWEKYDAEKLASENGFLKDPALVWGWYEWRRRKVLQTKPNAAHKTIAKLATVLPKVTLITQNVDDLHERAGSKDVLHLHGSIHKARCIDCEHPYEHSENEIPIEIPENKIEPPRCEKCRGLIRPSVVWFGESLPIDVWHQAEQAVEECDLLLIVGTSGLVYPAANLPNLAIGKGTPAIQVNPTPTDFDGTVTFNLKGRAGFLLPKMFDDTFGEKFSLVKTIDYSAVANAPHPTLLLKTWYEYVASLKNIKSIDEIESRLKTLRYAHNLLAVYEHFNECEEIQRQAFSGLVDDTTILGVDFKPLNWTVFGTIDSLEFIVQVKENNEHISRALDFIPLSGDIEKKHYLSYKKELLLAFECNEINITAATRLLAMKRPDYFICINNKNKCGLAKDLGFNASELNLENYWELVIEPIIQSCWWNLEYAPYYEHSIWDARVAILDAIYPD